MRRIIRKTKRSPAEALAKADGSEKKYKKFGLLNTDEHQRLLTQKK